MQQRKESSNIFKIIENERFEFSLSFSSDEVMFRNSKLLDIQIQNQSAFKGHAVEAWLRDNSGKSPEQALLNEMIEEEVLQESYER